MSDKRIEQNNRNLKTLYPEIACEWHPTKNGALRAEDVKPMSDKKVWWLCRRRGHSYQSVISSRTSGDNGCPYCSKRKSIPGETDLATLRPDIAAEWHPTKNNGVKPTEVGKGSDRKFWWKCPRGHEYEMSVYNRTRVGRKGNCPYCSKHKPIAGESDAGTICKEIYQFWDCDKNDTNPSDYLPNSGAKVWMKCEKGHSWQITILLFVRRRNCPYCNETKVEKGVNSLVDLYPEVAIKWDCEKNKGIDIDTVHLYSTVKYYWWKCNKNHSWMRSVDGMIKARNLEGGGCPYCSGSISKYSI